MIFLVLFFPCASYEICDVADEGAAGALLQLRTTPSTEWATGGPTNADELTARLAWKTPYVALANRTDEPDLPNWYDGTAFQCSLPPPRAPPASSVKASKIAVLMMLEDALPFAAVWSRYFGAEDPSRYVLRLHFHRRDIRERLGRAAFESRFGPVGLAPSIDFAVLPTAAGKWCHLTPVLAGFWEDVLADPAVTAVTYVSSSCLPVKPFSVLAEHASGDAALVNFADRSGNKAGLWSVLPRAAAEVVLNAAKTGALLTPGLPDVHPRNYHKGMLFCTEEWYVATYLRLARFPTEHTIPTFDCWSGEKLQAFNGASGSLALRKAAPCEMLELDATFLDALVASGSLFARKFDAQATVVEGGSRIPIADAIIERVLS
jgi:hypothetical protein